MSSKLEKVIGRATPLRVEHAEYREPFAHLRGPDWSLKIASPWRIRRGGEHLEAYSSETAPATIGGLVGESIVSAASRAGTAPDPVFNLSDGRTLEVFADTDIDPWVMHIKDEVFVGSSSDP